MRYWNNVIIYLFGCFHQIFVQLILLKANTELHWWFNSYVSLFCQPNWDWGQCEGRWGLCRNMSNKGCSWTNAPIWISAQSVCQVSHAAPGPEQTLNITLVTVCQGNRHLSWQELCQKHSHWGGQHFISVKIWQHTCHFVWWEDNSCHFHHRK